MTWYPTMVFYFGIFERVGPALGTIIGSNVAAAIILGATRWLMG